VFVSMEDCVAAADGYLARAFRICRAQGIVVVLRTYGHTPWTAVDPQVPYMKELTLRHFGVFFGEEPARGGRERGDFHLAVEALGDGIAGVLPGTVVADFEDLREGARLRELMGLLPDGATKVLVRVGG
jgi:(R,R)-butanediol dehydrogenase/meso-butanediol dehydrogenase/diacetyl reductase